VGKLRFQGNLMAHPTVRISGRVYAERPPAKGSQLGSIRRASLIVGALTTAAELCGERERRLYKTILEALAHAENWAESQRAERLPDAALWSERKSSAEP
jgi:hypothetical protein